MRGDPFALRVCLALVRLFSLIVPRLSRGEWRREWEAEFRHRHDLLTRDSSPDWTTKLDLIGRALGALPDAAWIRRQFTGDAEIVHDVRHGLRMLRSAPGFTLGAVTILAIGMGGTLAVATLLDTLFLRALPYAGAERIVTVWQKPASGGREDVAPANFLDWRRRSRSFSALAAIIPYSFDFTGDGEPEVFFGAVMTEGFLDVMGVRPALGRAFLAEEHVRGARKVVLISSGLWQRRFGSDPAIVNRTIHLDGEAFTVVGVLPADFRPQLLPRPGELSVWTPKVIQDHETRVRGSAWWNVVGRLAPGVSLQQAQAEMTAIAETLAQEHPVTNSRSGVEVVALRDHLMGDVRLPLLIMLAAVVVVLAIGCANVANLLLARGIQREREFAIRAALGAGRARLVRQLVLESLLLSGVAAATALAVAWWLIGGIVALAPANVLRLQDAVLDSRMLLLAFGLTTLTALAFGILPAVQFSRPAREAIREKRSSSPRAGARRVLVAAEIALAVVLLTCAGLLLRSFERLVAVDPGFSPRGTVALQVFAHDRNPTPDHVRAFFRASLDRVAELPGVEVAGIVSAMPFANANIDIRTPLEIVGRPKPPANSVPAAYLTFASPGFFRAMSVPLREGRLLDGRDTDKKPLVAVISEALKRREWAGESPLGRRIRVQWQGEPLEAEIVGVVSQLRHEKLDGVPRAEVFLSFEQVPFASMTFVIRGTGAPSELIAGARAAIWSVDPLQTFYETGSVEQMVASSLGRQRFSTTLIGVFAVIALLLSAIGLYGVISFATAQRTREIGVRMALGADRESIRRMVLREASGLVAAGIGAGILVSLAATQSLRNLLYEVPAIDPLTSLVVCSVLGGVALVAAYIPARRATLVDPVVALRSE